MIIRFVVVGVEGPFNLGLIARVCKNFAVDKLYLVKPKASLERALIYSAKAKDYLRQAYVVETIEEAVEGVDLIAATSAKGFSVGDVVRQAMDIEKFMELAKRVNGEIAVLFGRESTGLTREELKKADILVTIPANPEYPVLNLSHAITIFAWEFWKIRGLKAGNVPPTSDRGKVEELLNVIHGISREVLPTSEKVERVSRIWRNVLYKAYPSVYEVRTLIYWARRVLNKLKTKQD